MRFRSWQIFLLSVWLASDLQGQEVRRALPVTPTPAPAPRALPVHPDQVRGSQSILNENIPASQAQEPRRNLENNPDAKASTGSAAEPDSKTRDQATDDEIRLAPNQGQEAQATDPAKNQLAIADGLYIRKLYDLAVPEYEKYLGQYPSDPARPSAMYRLADCYGILGQEQPALNTYRMLIDEIGSGEYVGSAAFRLASHELDRKSYSDAASLYEKAFTNAKTPEVKLTARYYQAKCLELSYKRSEAKSAYEDVAKTPGKNPYRDAARLSLAYYALENSQRQQAFDLFQELGRDAVKPVVKAEALTRAGILASDLKQKDTADQLLRAAIALNTEGKWKQVAELELMKVEYEGDKFAQVLDSYAKSSNAPGDETRPSVMLLVANSYRQLGKHQKALELYNELIHIYPNSSEAYDARYQKLVSLDAMKDPSLVQEVDSYLATGPGRERADKSKLLKAQALYQLNRFEPAARLYLELTNSSLADVYKADCYYAAGYAFLLLKDNQSAMHAFSGLINKYPKHKMASKALLKRALLYQEVKNYPATTGGAQAYYWIGWAAFEAKKYQDAVTPLIKARELNAEEFAQKTSLRLMLCYQFLLKKAEAAREVNDFLKKDPDRASMVVDICRWLGTEYYNESKYDQAVKFLALTTKSVEPVKVDKTIWLMLAKSQRELKDYPDAIEAANHYLEGATEPADRSQGFLALGNAQLGAGQFDAAQKSAEQALVLQPEGRLNAEARMQLGDIELSRGNYENAARAYMSVAVLYEDAEVTPRALEHAYEAFQKAGNQPQATKTLSELKTRFPNYSLKGSTAG